MIFFVQENLESEWFQVSYPGLLISGSIWLTTFISKMKGIIEPTEFTRNPDQVTIINTGRIKIQGFEISGQISFTENDKEKTSYIKIDNRELYVSKKILKPNTPRTYNIDVTDCIEGYEFHSVQDVQNKFDDTSLTIIISYHGKFTNSLKWISKDVDLETSRKKDLTKINT